MRKNRAGPLRTKNNNNYNSNNIVENSNPSSSINWGEIDREVYENCFRFGSRGPSGLSPPQLSQPSTSGLQPTVMTNGVNAPQNGSSTNATYADDSDDEVFGIGTTANHGNAINDDQNFALNSALSFQKFLCSSSKKSSSSKMPNIQSSANEFDGNQQRMEEELRSLNQKLEATQRALSMMTAFIEQQNAQPVSVNINDRHSQSFNVNPHLHNQFDQSNTIHSRSAQISQQFFTALKQQHDLILNQNFLISDQNDLIFQWLQFTNTSHQSPLDCSLTHAHSHQQARQNSSHVHPHSHSHSNQHHSQQHNHTQERHPQSQSLFGHRPPSCSATGFLFAPNNSTTNYNAAATTTSAAPATVPSATLNNQKIQTIRPRTRENNFLDNFRSLSHQNDLHPNSGETHTQQQAQKNDFGVQSFTKVGNPFEFRNMLKSNRKKLNNFELPSTSSITFARQAPSSSAFPYQASIFTNNSTGHGSSSPSISSNLKALRGPSRVPRTVLNVANVAKPSEEEKNLKRPKKSNLNHVIGGLERHCPNVTSHNGNRNIGTIEHENELQNGQAIHVEAHHDDHVNDDDDAHNDDNDDDDDCKDDIIDDDHDSIDESSQKLMKLFVGNDSSNSSMGAGNSSFHHSTKVTSARPLMPAEGQSSEPIQTSLGAGKMKNSAGPSTQTSVSINGNRWPYRPPATGSINDSTLTTTVPAISSTLLSSVSSTLTNSEERLDDLNNSRDAQHSEPIVVNGVSGVNDINNLPGDNLLRPMLNGDGHDDIEEDDNFGLNSVSDTDVRLISLATAGTDAARHSSIRHSGDGEQGL